MTSGSKPSEETLRFDHLFRSETVRAGLAVENWQEAVKLTGTLLVESGGILPAYVDAMERVLRELGPYAVIAPGIVLLHARPDDGVLKPGLALVTLSTPVKFGHSQNDPVDIVIALAAMDKNSHIQALQRLADLLGNPEGLAGLRAAPNDEALFSVIKTWENHG